MTNEEIFKLVDNMILAELHVIARELRRRKISVDDPESHPLNLWAMTVYRGPRKAAPDLHDLVVGIMMYEDGDDVNFNLQVATVGGRELGGIGPADWASRNVNGILEQVRFFRDPDVIREVADDVEAYVHEPMGPKEWSPRRPKRRPEMGARRKMSREDVASRYGRSILEGMRSLAKKLRRHGLSVESPHEHHDPPNLEWWMAVFMPPRRPGGPLKEEDIDIHARISSELEGDVLFVYDISTVGGSPIAVADSEPASLGDPEEIRDRIAWLGSVGNAMASDAVLRHIRAARKTGPKEWSPRWPEE